MRIRRCAALCLALIAICGCRDKKPGNVRIDPALEALVPSDTVFVVGGNVDAIRQTAVYQKLLSRTPLPQLDEFTRQTGLDPRKDLSQILSCSNGNNGVLMARGKFNIGDLEARLAARGATKTGYKNHNVFESGRVAVSFLDDSTAVAGRPVEVREVIDRSESKGGGFSPAVRDLIRTIPPDDQVWAVLTGGLQNLNIAAPPGSNLGNIVSALKTIDTAVIGMDLASGLKFNAEVACQTERDAKFVHDMVRGVVGFGRLNTPDNHPEMLKLYDAIKVTQQQNRTVVTAEIPPDLADQFMDMWLKH